MKVNLTKLRKIISHPNTRLGLLILLVLLVVLLVTVYPPGRAQFKVASSNVSRAFDKIQAHSSVMVTADLGETTKAGRLVLKFDILDKDKPAILAMSERLGVGSDWQSGIELAINKQSLDKLSAVLPMKLNMEVNGNRIHLWQSGQAELIGSKIKGSFEFASSSGQLKVEGQDISNFRLSVVDPEVVLEESSKTGLLYLSKQLDGLKQILKNVASIELKIDGKIVDGTIVVR